MASDNILVAVKSRPFLSREKTEKLKSQWVVQQKEKAIYQIDDDGHRVGEPYTFDHIFDESSSNADVYNTIVEPLVQSCLEGFNSTIFAYGQTSSGKTHTMMGDNDTLGIIQHAVHDIFKHIEEHKYRRYLISCSYFEIYKEKINDLFDKNGQDLKIREDICGNTFVNAKQEVVSQARQVFDLMKIGNKIKKIGCTNMNERSSRSHTIFRFTIESRENNKDNGSVQISQLNLVDLAGSERIAHTKAAGVRLNEGITINKSLSALGNVIRQLSDGEGFISYRDSKLTRLLQHALGGNAKSLIIATITLAVGEETKSTLEFAQRAKVIKNKPIINEILTEQDKLKQYELVTAVYKERLEMETLRIQEMQREKDEREKEILKLKEHFRTINLFIKGSKETKPQSRIPRRHTVGHYGSQPALQPIPEATILQSTDTRFNIDTKEDMSYEEGDAMESLDYSEQAEEEFEEPVCDTSYDSLHTRLQHLEESYVSLKEFTKLEADCKDKSLIERLKTEKDSLLNEVVEYIALLKKQKEESEIEKLKLESEIRSLRREVDHQRWRNDNSVNVIEQRKNEIALLKQAKQQGRELSKFFDEQQEEEYKSNITCMTDIEKLTKQNKSENGTTENELLRLQINQLTEENRRLQEFTEYIHLEYQEDISQLQEEITKLQTQQGQEDAEILSKLYYLKDILEANHHVQNNLAENQNHNISQVGITSTSITDDNSLMEIRIRGLQEIIRALQKDNENVKDQNVNLAESVEILDTENNRLRTDIQKIKEDKENAEAQDKELTNTVVQLRDMYETKISILTDSVETKRAENSHLKSELDNLKKEKTIVENKKTEVEENMLKLADMVEDKEAENNQLTIELKSIKEEMGVINCERNELKKTILRLEDAYNTKISRLTKTIQTREIEINRQRLDIEKCMIEKTTIENERSEMEKNIIQLQHTVKNREMQNGRLNMELNNIKGEKVKVDNANLELKNMILRLEEARDTKALHLSKIGENKELENEQLKLDMEKIIIEKMSLEDEKERMEEQIRELEQALESKELEITQVKTELKDIKEEKAEIDIANIGLKDKILQLECAYDTNVLQLTESAETREMENNRLKSELETIRVEMTAIENDRSKMTQDIMELQQTVEGIGLENSQMRVELEDIKGEKASLEEANNKLKDMISQLEIAHDTKVLQLMNTAENKEIENSQLRVKLEKTETERATIENEKGKLEQIVIELRQIAENNEEQNNSLKSELETIKEEKVKINKANIELKNTISQLKEAHKIKVFGLTEAAENSKVEIHQLKADIEKIRTDNSIMNQNYGNLKEQIQQLKEKKGDIETDNAILLQKVQQLEKVSKELEKVRNRLLEEVKAMASENDRLKNKCEENLEEKQIIENKNKKLEKNIDTLKQQIKMLTDYNRQLIQEMTDYNNKIDDSELRVILLRSKENLPRISAARSATLDEGNKDSAGPSRFTQRDGACEALHFNNAERRELLEKLNALTAENIQLKEELYALKKEISTENSSTVSRVRDLKNLIVAFKSRIETVHTLVSSSTHRFKGELSPKEMRRRKRQSIHDQRRGIDNEDPLDHNEGSSRDLAEEDEIEAILTRLEVEIQYLISSRREDEIKCLKQEVEELKTKVQYCQKCQAKDEKISNFDKLQQQNIYKIVALQTQVYDLEEAHKIEKESQEFKIEYMKTRILQLETKQSPTMRSVETQCDTFKEEGQPNQMEDLLNQVKHLTSENEFLEFEVQGFIREHDDLTRYYKEQEDEIKLLKAEIEKAKLQGFKCSDCADNLKRMKELEDLHKKYVFDLAGMETKLFDMKSKHKIEMGNREDKLQFMKSRISELESYIADLQPRESNTIGTQCDTFKEEGQTDKMEDLLNQVKHLTSENEFLEFEVQGFIREHDDLTRYYKEQENEIKLLKAEIEKAKLQGFKCSDCAENLKRMKELEDLHKKYVSDLAGMETKVFDLKSKHKIEMGNQEDKLQFMESRISELESYMVDLQPRESNTIGIQCDLLDYTGLLGKYECVKQLARMRRAEANKLRSRLGMEPDEPVT